MALYHISVTVEDGEGQKSVVGAYVDSLTFDAAVTEADTLASNVLSLTDGRIDKVTVSYDLLLPAGNPATPAPSSDREMKAQFAFRCANGKSTRLSVPAIKSNVRKDNTDDLNTALGSVSGLINNMINGDFTDSNGSDITALISAKEAWGIRS